MRKYLFTILFKVILLAANTMYAQDNMKLTIDECISQAIANNHDFKKVKLDQEIAEEKVWEAYGSSLMPSIDGSVNYNRALKLPVITFSMNGVSQSFRMGSDNSVTASVNVTQPIFSGAMFLAIKIAETYANISEMSTDYSETELIVNVKQAYYNYLLSAALVKQANAQMGLAEKNQKDTKIMYDAGLVSEYDFLKADVQLKNIFPAVQEAEVQRMEAENALKLIMGLEPETNIEIADSLVFKEMELPDYNEGLKQVYRKNKLLRQLELTTELNDYAVDYQFTEHLPKIEAFGNYQVQSQEDDPRSFNDWRYNNSFAVGLTLRVPIFKGFTIDSKVQQAKIEYQKTEEDLAKTKTTLANNYSTTVKNIEKSYAQTKAYEASVNQAEKGYSIAKKRFNTGLATQLEVTSALVDVTSAKVNYLVALRDYYLNYARLEFIMGEN